ncbi:MAG: hypothetical protein HY295_04290 [Thaumarchaeota archaeon]|nr:hypothetical protein [Nitrososphaerota archaeon]
MIKRGYLILIIGAVLIGSSFVIAFSILPDVQSSIESGKFLPSLESMFDSVSEKTQILPGDSYSFPYTSKTSQVGLMWGLKIMDYEQMDRISVSISNIFGDDLGKFESSDSVLIETFKIPKVDTYNFNVLNEGKRPISVIMMFTENPEHSETMANQNLPFFKNLIPLAVSGFLLIIGIIVLFVGTILSILDWRKGKNQSRYI